jgi:hypothetical protein
MTLMAPIFYSISVLSCPSLFASSVNLLFLWESFLIYLVSFYSIFLRLEMSTSVQVDFLLWDDDDLIIRGIHIFLAL